MGKVNSNDDWDESLVGNDLSAVEEKCEEYIEMYRNGVAPGFDEFAAQTPELELQILELLPTIVMMEGARSRSLGYRKDGRVIRGPEKIPKLGDYRIVQELGRGGMGIVYEAHQLSLNRLVAIKLLPKHMLSDEQVVKFRLEASTAAKLHHTNIAPIYGVGESGGFHYYAMQLLDGVSLDCFVSAGAELVPERGKLTLDDVVSVGQQIATALQYAHDQDVLHRDIKPSNLILDSNKNVWITDFGLAISKEHAGAENGHGGVHAGNTSGTLRYMAPEKLDGCADEDTADIYSLGVTLIELLSGRPAFSAVRIGQLTSDIKSGNLNELTFNGQKLPSDLEAVLRKSININPDERYQSAGDFGSDLQNVLSTRPVSAKRKTMTGSTWLWFRRNRELAAALAIALAMLITTSVVSTLAYFHVQDAFDAEQKQRVIAETASRVASDAMDQMFRQFAGGSSLFDRSLESGNLMPQLTNDSAVLAKQLNDFYLQLATENIGDDWQPVKTLAARSRVGELNQRLGKYEDAAEAFQISIEGYERLVSQRKVPDSTENVIRIAQLANSLGVVKGISGNLEEADAAHQKAIDLLNSRTDAGSGQKERLDLELARSHYFKGRMIRPGMGPNSFPPIGFSRHVLRDQSKNEEERSAALDSQKLDSLNRAIGLLKNLAGDLASEDGAIPDQFDSEDLSQHEIARNEIADAARYLLALCFRELVDDDWSQRTDADREYQVQAIKLLEELDRAYPHESMFRFELMKTLAELNILDSNGFEREVLDETIASIRQAIVYGTNLIQEQPDITIYRVEMIHCRFKLGRLIELKLQLIDPENQSGERKDLIAEQEHAFKRAFQGQLALRRNHDNSPAYGAWAARFALSWASCECMKSRPEERNRLIGRVTTFLNDLPDDILENPEMQAIMKEANAMNQRSLTEPDSSGSVN